MLFPLLWRLLPGPVWLRAVLLLGLLSALVWALFEVGFPWLAANVLPSPDARVG